MSRLSVLFTAALALGIGAAANATTVPIAVDGAWNQFDVDVDQSGGPGWVQIDGTTPLSFSFTSAVDVVMTVVDGGFAGDRFNVLDNGAPLGSTSSAANSFPISVSTNFDAALASGNYSFATFLLAAGTHVISGSLLQSALDDLGDPLNATVGALRVNAVPLPASLVLLLSGSGLLGVIRRRRVR